MRTQGVNRDYLRKKNRGVVLQLIATGKCSSRIELSREMGLTKTAISSIVGELIEKKYIVEGETELIREQGRNPVKLAISGEAPKFAGVLIQRGYVEAAVVDMGMNIEKYERTEEKWKDKNALTASVFRLLDHMTDSDEKILGIGISSIGPVDIKKGRIVNPGYFFGIENVDIAGMIADRYHLPIAFDHDNQNAALVEQLYGNGRGYHDILMIGIGKGVGSGIIMEGSRYHSHSGFAPEIGHLSINQHGNRCWCGNIGCLETYIGTEAIEEKVLEKTGRTLKYREICQAEAGSSPAGIMEEMVEDLAGAIVSALNILNSEVVLLGIEGVYWHDRYLKMLETLINERKFSNKTERTLVRKTFFEEKTQILGAACSAVRMCYNGDLVD